MTMDAAQDLVDVAIAAGVRDAAVLDAVRNVRRERFVPPGYEHEARFDAPVPIPHEQVTSQPSLIARMVEALGLTGQERVLEIGSGYGYQTALLARLTASVVAVERWAKLAEGTRDNLAREGFDNVTVVTGDGTQGEPAYAPYDGVVVAAAFPEVPDPLVEQVRHGGRLVQPIGTGGGESVVLFERTERGLDRVEEVSPARFVRLLGRHGYQES